MTTTHKLVASLAGVLLLIAAVVMAISFWAFSQIKEAAEARKHTFVVIDSANGCAAEAFIGTAAKTLDSDGFCVSLWYGPVEIAGLTCAHAEKDLRVGGVTRPRNYAVFSCRASTGLKPRSL